MRNYKTTDEAFITPRIVKDEFVKRSRDQALNVGISRFLIFAALLGSCQILLYYFTGLVIIHLWLPIAFVYGLYKYAEALADFTQEDRNILWSQYFGDDNITKQLLPKEETETNDTITVIPNTGRGHYNLHVGLTVSQLKHIAETMLNTNTLTVNYLESIGLSRQNSERLRAELAEFDMLIFDKTGRTKLTKDGQKICNKILK